MTDNSSDDIVVFGDSALPSIKHGLDDPREYTAIGYIQRLECACGGELKFTGTVLTCNPPLFAHRCNKCGAGRNAKGTFPRVVFRGQFGPLPPDPIESWADVQKEADASRSAPIEVNLLDDDTFVPPKPE